MEDKIIKLKSIYRDIEIIISMLEGKWPKDNFRDGGTVSGELECYKYEGDDLKDVIDELLMEHGEEILLTRD